LRFRFSPFLFAYLVTGPILLCIVIALQAGRHTALLRHLHLSAAGVGTVALPLLEILCLACLVLLYFSERLQLRRDAAAGAEIAGLNTTIQALQGRIELLDDTNRGNHAMIARLKAEITDRKREYESELQRLTEQAYSALKQQVDAQSRQYEAVGAAVRNGASGAAAHASDRGAFLNGALIGIAHLTPAELAAINDDGWGQEDSAAVVGAGVAGDGAQQTPAADPAGSRGRARDNESPFGNWSRAGAAESEDDMDYTLRSTSVGGEAPVALRLTDLPSDGRDETSDLPVPLPNLRRAVGE
jgi:hypothetical protein